MSKLNPVTPGELLLEEFLKPMGWPCRAHTRTMVAGGR
jgi:plasmid maintenance system antidote protein VapI